jgi:hypothetical protein
MTGRARLPDQRMIPRWTAPSSRPTTAHEETLTDDPPAEQSVDEALKPPFFVTGGRTQRLQDGLRIHTILTDHLERYTHPFALNYDASWSCARNRDRSPRWRPDSGSR